MRRSYFIAGLIVGFLVSAWFATGSPTLAIAHEAHKAECNDTVMNATKADIQAMPDGEAKTTAEKEVQMAEAMMAKKDFDGCVAHLHKATEAMEE